MRIKDEFARDNLTHVAAGIAFYGLLALFPGISAAISMIGILIDPTTIMDELDRLSAILPREAAEIILGQARAVAASGEGRLGFAFFVGLVLAFYSSSKGMQSLMDGLNMAHNEVETRGILRRTFLKLGLTMVLISGLLVGVATALILPAILTVLGLTEASGVWVASLRWPLMAILTVAGLRILYWLGPDHKTPHRGLLTWGTLAATVMWVCASLGFSFYVTNFASYNETFGALGGAIILLMWLWISGLVILIGAEIDSMIEAVRNDPTLLDHGKPA